MTDPRNEATGAGTGDDVRSEHPNRNEPQPPPPDAMTDEEAQRVAADQTARTSRNADKAGKDWDGDPDGTPENL